MKYPSSRYLPLLVLNGRMNTQSELFHIHVSPLFSLPFIILSISQFLVLTFHLLSRFTCFDINSTCTWCYTGLGSIQIGIGIELELNQNGWNWNWNWKFSRDRNWNWNWLFGRAEFTNSIFNSTNSYLLSCSVTSFTYTRLNLHSRFQTHGFV